MKRRTWIWLGVCFVALFSVAWIKRPRSLRAEFAAANIELKPIPLGPTPWAGHQLLAGNANAFEVSEKHLYQIFTVIGNNGVKSIKFSTVSGPGHVSLTVDSFSTEPRFRWLGSPQRVWIVHRNDDMAKMYFEPPL